MKRYTQYTLHTLLVLVLAGSFLLTGCADSAFVDEEAAEQADLRAPTQDASKFRMAHLLNRTKNNYRASTQSDARSPLPNGKGKGKGGNPPPDPEPTYVPLILGMSDTVLDANKLLTRYKLLSRYEFDTVFNGLAVEIDQTRLDSFLQAIENDPDIEWVEPDIFIMPESQDDANERTRDQVIPWGIERIGATQSSTLSGNHQDSVDVDLYIMDTGVKEQDLRVVESLKFLHDESNGRSASDQNGHGTHIAGTAAAFDDDLDVVGVAPGAHIHSVKVLDDGGQTELSNVIAAVDYLTKRKLMDPSQPMVVNLSFGADIETTEYNALDRAIQASIQAGVIYVLSAGNEGIDAATVTPAHVEEAITVGAYNPANKFMNFSNYGSVVDLLAPGVDVLSVSITPPRGANHRLALMNGTSMAAPHVAGAAALYVSQHPNAHPHQVRNALVRAGRSVIWGQPAGTTDKTVWVGDF